MTSSHPYLSVCPYLELDRAYAFGRWEIGPLAGYDGRWPEEQFEATAKAFLRHFIAGIKPKPIANPAIIAPRDAGPDGILPSKEERLALEVAIAFATIDQNSRFTQEALNHHRSTTTDNADVQFWPVDLHRQYVSLSFGRMVTVSSAGWRIGDDDLRISAPTDLYLAGRTLLDADTLSASYEVFLRGCTEQTEDNRLTGLLTAASWLAKAWRNTESVGSAERVVFLKTGFEALLGTHKSREAARRLARLFQTVSAKSVIRDDELLWSPGDEPTMRRRRGNGHEELMTPLEHWFMAMADARNQIVHGGPIKTLVYEEKGSRFAGHLMWTAEWILRKAIKLRFEECGFPDLWRWPIGRRWRRSIERAAADHVNAPDA